TVNAMWNVRSYCGDSVLRHSSGATRLLGNDTPSNTDDLNNTDDDLGSASPVVLGGCYLSQGGKDGKIRVLSAKRMRGVAPHKGGELQIVSTPSGTDLFTAPAVWRHAKVTWMFAADDGGTAAWRFRNG